MHFTRDSISIVASTAARTYYSRVANGGLYSVVLSTGTTLVSTDVMSIKNEGTGETVHSKALGTTKRWNPRTAITRSTGTIVYQTTGTANPTVDLFEFAEERAVVSLPASTGTGTLWLAWEGN